MPKSKISSSLSKKRKTIFIKKIGVIFVFILLLISLFILFLTNDKIRIKNVSVVGNSSVSIEEISNIVEEKLNKRYLWIIPTDNIFLLQRFKISKEILKNIKKVKTVKINFENLNEIKITISERVSESIWCFKQLKEISDCYFMDDFGFIFAKAPYFTNNIFLKYYGLILDDDPIGRNYFDPDKFEEIKIFISEIRKMGFEPESFFAIDGHQYEVTLSGGAKIMFDDEEDFSKNLLKLSTLIENNYIKTEIEEITKINHIDLRYGNKVHFDFK
ncbi:MAG: hypothetical protein WCR40_01445 [Candidatus Paceibacterota bacterium]